MNEKTLKLPSGFERARYTFKPRIIMAVDSVFRKEGKTHFSMTAPDPIVYLSLDKQSREDVLSKFPHKTVYDKSYVLKGAKDEKSIIAEIEKDFGELCRIPEVRTIVIDTGSDVYGLLQLAKFGKALSIPPFRYYEINQWFANVIINPVVNSDKNLIINYFMSKEYVKAGDKDVWSGGYERKGFRDSDGLSQLNIRLSRNQKTLNYEAVIMNSSQNAAAVGKTFVSNPYIEEPSFDLITGDDEIDYITFAEHQCSFPFVARTIFPETRLTDWI